MCQSGLLWCNAYIAGIAADNQVYVEVGYRESKFFKMNTKILCFLIFIPYCRAITWSEQRIGYLVMRTSSIH